MAELKEDRQPTIFESLEFIFRHPWLFISPFVIILSVVFAQLSDLPLIYQSSALVSFEAEGSTKLTATSINFIGRNKTTLFIKRFLSGQGGRDIVKEAWPQTDEKKNPREYRERLAIVQWIDMKYDDKTELLSITFRTTYPDACYKMVDATVKALKAEIKRVTRGKIESGIEFLRKQEEYYKNKIQDINEEITKIKSELNAKSQGLTEKERILINEIMGEGELTVKDQTKVRKLAKYDELSSELQLQLLEFQKKRDALNESLETQNFFVATKNPEDDTYVRQYSNVISDKQLSIENLSLQGFLEEHPQIKRLESEIAGLKELKRRRIEMLEEEKNSKGSKTAKKIAEENVRLELSKTELEIDTLNEKISMIKEKYSEISAEPLRGQSVISNIATRLKELRSEKEISQKYYQDIRRRYAEEELRGRVEEAEAGVKLIVVKEPDMPSKPIPFQKTPKIIWGFIISLFIGAGLSYGADSLDSSIKSATELRELLHAPILGSVDKIATTKEVNLNRVRRNVVLITLIVFALSAKFLLKLKLFQIIFGFLK